MRRDPWVGALLALAVAAGAPAARIATLIEEVDASRFPAIELRVNVFARKPLPALTADAFRLAEDGEPVEGFEVELDGRPLYVALVLDRSGSMRPAITELKRSAFGFVDAAPRRSLTQLVSFGSDVRAHAGFLQDPLLLKRVVSTLRADGGTRLYDALGKAVADLASYPDAARRVVVCFTDGKDSHARSDAPLSDLTAKDVARRARGAGVPLFFVGLGRGVNGKVLKSLAAYTGGRTFYSPTAKDLEVIFADAARSLETSYRVRYATPRPDADGTVRALAVTSRAAGAEDQGTGKYRAPTRAELAVRETRDRDGVRRYGEVMAAVRDLGRYRVEVDTRTTASLRDGGARAPVRSRMLVTRDASGGAARSLVISRAYVGGRDVSVQVLSGEGGVQVAVGRPDGASLTTRLEGEAAAGFRDPVARAAPLLVVSGGALPAGARVVVIGDGVLEVTHPGAVGATARIEYDPATRLPRRVVQMDPGSGASREVLFRGWTTEGVEVPAVQAVAAGAEAQRFAGEFAGRMLDATGGIVLASAQAGVLGAQAGALGARAGALGAQAGALGARAGLAGARAGLAAAAKGLEAADLAWVATFDPAAADRAARDLGTLAALADDPGFVKATRRADASARYWTSFAESYAEAAEIHAEEVASETTRLARDLDASAADFDARMEDFGRAMETYGEGMDAFGRAMDDWGRGWDAWGADVARAVEAASAFSVDAERLAADATALAAETTADALLAAEEARRLGEEAAAMGAEAGEWGRELGSSAEDVAGSYRDYGESMRDLGSSMRDLGSSMRDVEEALRGLR